MGTTREEVAAALPLLGTVVMAGTLLLSPIPAAACVPAAALAAAAVVPLLWNVEIKKVLLFLISLMIIADGDYSGKPVPTIYLADLIFTQIIPSVPTIFELIAGGLFAAILIKAFSTRGDPAFRTHSFRVLLAVGVLVISAMIWAAAYGIGTGGQLRIAFWQTRSFPLFLIWAIIGFHACASIDDARKFIDMFVVAVLVKSVMNIIFLWVYFGGHIAGKSTGIEYLSSHVASLFMATAILRLIIRLFFQSQGRQRLWILAAILTIAYPWIMNDRRVSFLGLTFVVVFSPLFLYPLITKSHVRRGMVVLLVLLAFVAATWNNPGHSVKSLFVKDPKEELDYRDIENYNLYRAVAEHPITGKGYGSPFKQYMQLADIFSNAAETLAWVPHNNILMIWAFSGPLGLSCLGLVIAFSIAAMVRLFRSTAEPEVRIFAFVGYGVFVQWTLYFWADMALMFSPSMMFPSVLAGFAYKLLSLRERGCSYG